MMLDDKNCCGWFEVQVVDHTKVPKTVKSVFTEYKIQYKKL